MNEQKPQIKAEVVTITPETARKWLRQNDNFRQPNGGKILAMAEIMKTVGWELNGETIKFGADGRLHDGQNRLQACVKANVPFQSVVVWGVESTEQVDVGEKRSFPQLLAYKGYNNSLILGGAVRMMYFYEKNGRPVMRELLLQKTLYDFVSVYDRFALERYAARGNEMKKDRLFTPSCWTFAFWKFAEIDETRAEDFHDQVASGLNLVKGSPALALRRYIQEQRRDTLSRNIRTSNDDVAIIFKAFNNFMEEISTERLDYNKDEPFPKLIGADKSKKAVAV